MHKETSPMYSELMQTMTYMLKNDAGFWKTEEEF